MWVKRAREIHVGQDGLNLFGVSAARSWERREGIIDLLCVHFLRHLLQDVHCRWDAGAAEPLGCHSVARLMLLGKNPSWKGKWSLRHFKSSLSESSATCLAGWRTGWCLSVRKKRAILDAFFHLEHFLFPPALNQLQSGVLPQAISLPRCQSYVVTCHCSLSLGFNWAHAVCHLEESLRSEVAALTAIEGSAEPPQLLALPYAAWLEHPEVLQGCEETPEDVIPWRETALPCGAEEVLPKFSNCIFN